MLSHVCVPLFYNEAITLASNQACLLQRETQLLGHIGYLAVMQPWLLIHSFIGYVYQFLFSE